MAAAGDIPGLGEISVIGKGDNVNEGYPISLHSVDVVEQARRYFEQATGPQTLTLRRNGSTLTVIVLCRALV
jgi:hypothetical protein